MHHVAFALLLAAPAPRLSPDAPSDTLDVDRHVHPRHFDAAPTIAFDQALDLSQRTDELGHLERGISQRTKADQNLPRSAYNPQLNVQPGVRVLPRDELTGTIQAQITQSWNLRDLGRARRRAARAETRAMTARVRAVALARRLEAARAWIDLHAAEQGLELARAELNLAQQLMTQMREAFAEHVATRADLAEAREYVTSVDARVLALEGHVHDLGLVLALAAGKTPHVPLATMGSPPEPALPELDALARVFEQAETLPAAVAAKLEVTAARAGVVEARAERGTVMWAGAAVQREAPEELIAAGVIGVSIPMFDRGQLEVARARLHAERLEAEAARSARSVRSELAMVVHEVEHARLVEERIESERLPALLDSVSAHEEARLHAEGTVFEVLHARRRLLEAKSSLAAARGDRRWAELKAWLYLAQLAQLAATEESR